MNFEVYVKYGNRWSYKGVYSASCSRSAALHASYIHQRKVIGVRPDGCYAVNLLVYQFQHVASLASGV